MSYVHDLARERLIALQARYLTVYPASAKGTTTASAALPLMSRDQLAAAILAREAEVPGD